MVETHLASRGIRDRRVLDAMAAVPREHFVPPGLEEFAYEDAPLPIGEGQTISQPYIVALMIEALRLAPTDRVLEVGTGSGYAAAVLSRLAGEVITVERISSLAETARRRLEEGGYDNVRVVHAESGLGFAEGGPYDAILVSAGAPDVPESLLAQLASGGRMLIPVGSKPRSQELILVVKRDDGIERNWLGSVRFVPLVGRDAWSPEEEAITNGALPDLITHHLEPFRSIDDVDLAPLLERIGDARLVLLGEATHGTSEFYRMRARITQELILRKGFSVIALEADWPDALAIERGRELQAFDRFPTWMWKNVEMLELINWVRAYHRESGGGRVRFAGLDLYSLHASINEVLRYLDDVDPATAEVARVRFGCLTPWEGDPEVYGRAVLSGRYSSCEREVVRMLEDLLKKRIELEANDGERFFDAAQNARLIVNAERYYREMYYGGASSWNLRDRHMFDTLEALLGRLGPEGKIVVWAHNSHVGDASYTEMGIRGEVNIGSLARAAYGEEMYSIGFGTDRGRVMAARDWNGPHEVMQVEPSHASSYEHAMHETGEPCFFLRLRSAPTELRRALGTARLERAIGVIYRPRTEIYSHYFQAILPRQFDEYVWFDVTDAVTPLGREVPAHVPETYPSGL